MEIKKCVNSAEAIDKEEGLRIFSNWKFMLMICTGNASCIVFQFLRIHTLK